jgi:hypothetical protein
MLVFYKTIEQFNPIKTENPRTEQANKAKLSELIHSFENNK